MVSLLARMLKHVIVLLLGGVVVYLATVRVLPFLDNLIPVVLAVFGTYLATAYGLIPLAFRAFRLFYHPIHLPLYCTTPDGFASDPVNIALVGGRQQVILAMEAAGWHRADPKTPLSIVHQVVYTLLQRSYPTAPMSTLYLFGRQQDLAFEKEIPGSLGHRHHVRFWVADTSLAKAFDAHVQFWRRFHIPNRRTIPTGFWVGASSKDTGFALVRHNAQVTHMIDPDTISERKLITTDLRRADKLLSDRTVPVHRPFSLRNRALRGSLHSDGYITICELR
jgi:hypothetical protein